MGISQFIYHSAFGAVFNLDHPTHYLRWGWLQISVGNFIVILVMIALFILALVVPFPGNKR